MIKDITIIMMLTINFLILPLKIKMKAIIVEEETDLRTMINMRDMTDMTDMRGQTIMITEKRITENKDSIEIA